MKTIALCGGGTAGHIIPLVAVLPYLKKEFDRILYFSSGKELELKLMRDDAVEIIRISPPALKRSLSPENLLIPCRLAKSVTDCKKELKHASVDLVFSKGGYCALPVCLGAKSLGIPYFCHESDLSLGLANKLTYKRSVNLLTVFPETAQKYKGICVGPPIRPDFGTCSKGLAKRKLGIADNGKPVLLVTGGSQGSKTINDAVRKNLYGLLERFTVLHLCGKDNKSGYNTVNGYYEFEFANMSDCLSACDLALSRGGSNSLFEIAYCHKPILVAPLKKGSRGDQFKNAAYFEQKGALKVCDEEELDESVTDLLDDLWSKRNYYIENMQAMKIENGTVKTAKIICDYVNNGPK